MSRKEFVSVPCAFLDKNFGLVEELGLNLEMPLDWESLNDFPSALKDRLLKEKSENGLKITFHAPFSDMIPGASDPLAREATRTRIKQTAALATELGPEVIVVHSGYDDNRYWMNPDGFVSRSVDFWSEAMEMMATSGCKVALENVFETEPGILAGIMDGVGSERFGACFDAGHFNLFSKVSLEEWLDAVGGKLFELHIHNNYGEKDDHNGMESGVFDFDRLFGELHRRGADPVLTIEAHTKEGVVKSLEYLEKLRREYPAAAPQTARKASAG